MNLKFRAWHKKLKIMRSVHHMWWHFEPLQLFNIECISPDAKTYESWNTFTEEIELMQWSGCVDKNSTPIFAGDILFMDAHDTLQFTIKFLDGVFWAHDIESDDYDILASLEEQDLLIAGNIYENPELLEQK